MNFTSIALVTFILLDQLVAIYTPFSSGAGLVIFMASLLVNVFLKNRSAITKQWVMNLQYSKLFNLHDVLICMAIILYSIIATALAPCKSQMTFSLATVGLIVFIWFFIKWYLTEFKFKNLIEPNHALIGLIIIFICLCMAVSGYDLYSNLRGTASNRPSGLFLEPSHLALFGAPLMLVGIASIRTRLLSVLLTTFIFVLAYSLTFIVLFWAISGIYIFYLFINATKVNQKVIKLSMLICLATIFIITLHGAYIAERTQTQTQTQTQNFSTLVYKNGWHLAMVTLLNTSSIGLGLGNMGCSNIINMDKSTLSADVIAQTKDSKLISARDGSFLTSKLISELGVVGFLIILWMVLKGLLIIARVSQKSFDLITAGSIGLFFVLFFVRGLPYFSAVVFYCLLQLTMQKQK